MSFHRSRTAGGRRNQQVAIGRAYASRWRPVDPADLPIVLGALNGGEVTLNGRVADVSVTLKPKFTVIVGIDRTEYRLTLAPDAPAWTDDRLKFTATDVERAERRPC